MKYIEKLQEYKDVELKQADGTMEIVKMRTSTQDIVNKINEIIDYINSKKDQLL